MSEKLPLNDTLKQEEVLDYRNSVLSIEDRVDDLIARMTLEVSLLSLATAAHQGWSANLFTTVQICFQERLSVLLSALVAIGGMLIATAAGFILHYTGSYMILFVLVGSLYLIALLIFNLLVPEIDEIDLKK
jgi:nitrate/nitrite transporter NarK